MVILVFSCKYYYYICFIFLFYLIQKLFEILLFLFYNFALCVWFGFIKKEYSEEFRDIAKQRVKDAGVGPGGITLLTQKSVSDELPVRHFS